MFKSYKLDTGETLYVSLVSDVKDIIELKKKILDQSLKCCCLTPKLILDTFQVAVAADKACLARSRNKLVTRNIYTEILYNLSISKHISKSLVKFGMQENDSNVIVAVIGNEEDLKAELSKIKGCQINVGKLEELVDKKAINKEYNISVEELKKSPQIDSIITRIATKNL